MVEILRSAQDDSSLNCLKRSSKLSVRWIVFDAVGTLISPLPDAATVYHATGQRYGSLLSVDEVAARFGAAFQAGEENDHVNNRLRTNEGVESDRWRHRAGRAGQRAGSVSRRPVDGGTATAACLARVVRPIVRRESAARGSRNGAFAGPLRYEDRRPVFRLAAAIRRGRFCQVCRWRLPGRPMRSVTCTGGASCF